MTKFFIYLFILIGYSNTLIAMEAKPYHHLSDGTFRNPEGSPVRDSSFNWSFKVFNEEKKKLDITVPDDHVINKSDVLNNLNKYKQGNYVAWIGHATFLIKLGKTTIITDPVFEKNMGPLIFGPKRFVDPALKLNELPKIDLFLLTHNHYDHLSTRTIQRFPFKKAKVLAPLKLGKYFVRNGFRDVNEMDWYEEIKINDLKVTLVPAVHWSKRSLWDTNKTLWGSFIIEYQGIKIFFACDTGYGNIYKDLGKKYGPIDLTLINIGAYNFYPMAPVKDKSIYHTNPEEALQIGKDLNSKKMLGMHWGTVVLSLEPIMEPAKRFKNSAKQFGFDSDEAIIFKIGQVETLENIIK